MCLSSDFVGTTLELELMAEGEGFEPPLPVKVKRFSKPPCSTTHTSLRGLRHHERTRHCHNDTVTRIKSPHPRRRIELFSATLFVSLRSPSMAHPRSLNPAAFARTLASAKQTMVMSEIARIAFDSFSANKVRFALTALGMVIGSASVILVVSNTPEVEPGCLVRCVLLLRPTMRAISITCWTRCTELAKQETRTLAGAARIILRGGLLPRVPTE